MRRSAEMLRSSDADSPNAGRRTCARAGSGAAARFVEVEFVRAQFPGHRSLFRAHGQALVGQPVVALRQGRGQGRQRKRVVGAGDAGKHLAQPALRVGHQRMAVGRAAETQGLQPMAGGRRQAWCELFETGSVNHGDGGGAGGNGFLEVDGHGVFAEGRFWYIKPV